MGKIVIVLGIIGFIAIMDTSFMMGIIASYARKVGADEAQAGLIAGLYSIVAIPASILAGYLVDRLGRKKMLTIGLAGDALFVFLYSIAASPLQLAVYRVLHALGGSLVYPASLSIVASGVRETQLGRAVSLFLVMVASSVALGSFLGGHVVESYGFTAAFRILSIILLGGLVIAVLMIPEELGKKTDEKQHYGRALKEGLSYITAGSVAIFVLYISFGFIVGGLPQILQDMLGYSHEKAAGVTGKFIGVSPGFSIIFFVIAGLLLDKSKHVYLAPMSFLSLSISMALIQADLLETTFLITSVLLGFAIATLMTISTWIMLKVSQEVRGISMGIQQTVNIIGTALGATMSGILLKAGLGNSIFLIPAVVGLAGLLIYNIVLRRK